MYDFLITSDFMVPDPDYQAELFMKHLGVHGHAKWRLGPEVMPTGSEADQPFLSHFLRVNKSLAQAPTRLQTQAHFKVKKPVDPVFEPHLESLAAFQGEFRPMKTHSITVAYNDIAELIERLTRKKLRFRIAPLDEYLPFERVWTGVTPQDPRYLPDVDGGMMFEFHPGWPLGHPAETYEEPYPEPEDPAPGEMIRLVARSMLTADLDESLQRLADNLDWEPTGPVRVFEDEGIKCATLGFNLQHSGTIDLVEPTRWACDTGKFIATWGPGPYYTRIAVNGLDAKAADLDERGTTYTWMPESETVGGRRIQVDPEQLDGKLIEFVEWEPRK
jgi:hypothetical protein